MHGAKKRLKLTASFSLLLPALVLEDRSQLTDADASELRLFQSWPMYKRLLNIMGGILGGAIGLFGLYIVLTNQLMFK